MLADGLFGTIGLSVLRPVASKQSGADRGHVIILCLLEVGQFVEDPVEKQWTVVYLDVKLLPMVAGLHGEAGLLAGTQELLRQRLEPEAVTVLCHHLEGIPAEDLHQKQFHVTCLREMEAGPSGIIGQVVQPVVVRPPVPGPGYVIILALHLEGDLAQVPRQTQRIVMCPLVQLMDSGQCGTFGQVALQLVIRLIGQGPGFVMTLLLPLEGPPVWDQRLKHKAAMSLDVQLTGSGRDGALGPVVQPVVEQQLSRKPDLATTLCLNLVVGPVWVILRKEDPARYHHVLLLFTATGLHGINGLVVG